jgi:hypothetical protein
MHKVRARVTTAGMQCKSVLSPVCALEITLVLFPLINNNLFGASFMPIPFECVFLWHCTSSFHEISGLSLEVMIGKIWGCSSCENSGM